jgi:TolB-like protein
MATSYKFGPFRLEAEREVLLHGTEPVAIGRRAVALLRILVEQPGALISKDTLIKAAWGGLAVEENNLPVQIGALRRALEEAPGHEHRIETLPRRGYRFVGTVAKETQGGGAVTPIDALPRLALPDRPSIAVLPFINMSGDPEQDYFADGIVEDIITALSRMRWLFVIARNSSFTYKGRPIDVKLVGRELGVRYLLEGSVRRAENRVRITTQLIDATSGAHIWVDRFDGTLDDIFEIQDRVATSVVGAIARQLEQAEIERSRRKPTESLVAYDYYLRGMASFNQRTKEAVNEALRQFYKAIDLDPGFASAYGMAAWCYGWRKINNWTEDRSQETAETRRLSRRAAELGQDDAVALSRGAHALAYVVGELDDAATFVDRALVLNPNLAGAWYASGWGRVWLGEADVAITHFAQAMRLSPLDPQMITMQAGTAFAHFLAGRYEEALSWANKARWEQTNYLTPIRLAAACYGLTGQMAEAHEIMTRVRELDPSFRVSNVWNWAPLRRPDDLARLEQGLRKAGLPE